MKHVAFKLVFYFMYSFSQCFHVNTNLLVFLNSSTSAENGMQAKSSTILMICKSIWSNHRLFILELSEPVVCFVERVRILIIM